jgi:AcrR family transcriptional regulator
MRALPGRASRSSAEPAHPTASRGSAKADQRRRILRATGELVAKRGYGDVTVPMIVKQAPVSPKTFYVQFSGKEEAFLELFDGVIADAQKQIGAALAVSADASWPAQVVIAVRTLFDVILSDPLIARAVIVEAPTVGPIIIERYESAMATLSPLLAHGRELNPSGKELPVTLEDTLAGGILWSAYQRLIVGEVDRIELLAPEAIEFVLRPYLGEGEAVRWARWSPQETSEPVSALP